MATLKRIVMLGSLLFGALTFFGPAPAEAHDQVKWKNDVIGGCLEFMHVSYIGSITGNSGTCDGDNRYYGRVRDDHATNDGSCVRAVLQDIVMTVSCNSTGSGFQYTDPAPQDGSALTCMTETNSNDRACARNTGF